MHTAVDADELIDSFTHNSFTCSSCCWVATCLLSCYLSAAAAELLLVCWVATCLQLLLSCYLSAAAAELLLVCSSCWVAICLQLLLYHLGTVFTIIVRYVFTVVGFHFFRLCEQYAIRTVYASIPSVLCTISIPSVLMYSRYCVLNFLLLTSGWDLEDGAECSLCLVLFECLFSVHRAVKLRLVFGNKQCCI